ncbi:C-glycoside deglycosidase beta subunit domain-containing protein [Actinomyces ruminicola]|uniref:C-deglycosylation enzyme beta subunit n=1 Tax=Actinomyces ruminicola TaxID=332524 RepID=A0A1G9V617_9ACTO|nr:DUF6379 domain-containing protein [Actinomyces ruminicola]SDM67335.1 hypothetical protein SAMN04487766_105106 [Actinomyces ruminicola]
MFDEMIIHEGTVRNVTGPDGEVTGFSFESHIPYYRGLGLSMIETPEVTVDGEAVPEQDLRFTYNGVTRTFDELADVSDVRWELRTFATITVLRPGGLAPGEHDLHVNLRLRVSYLPFTSENRFTRKVTVA